MAMVMLGMFALNPVGITGSIIQQLNHGISTGALFLIVGIVYERRHTREISEYGGLSKVMPVYAAVFLMMTMSSIGLPTLNGFIGEFLILQGVFVGEPRSGRRFAAAAAWCSAPPTCSTSISGRCSARSRIRRTSVWSDLNAREFATFAPLIILAVWIGIYPKPFLDRLNTSVNRVVARVSPQHERVAADCTTAGTPSAGTTNARPRLTRSSWRATARASSWRRCRVDRTVSRSRQTRPTHDCRGPR